MQTNIQSVIGAIFAQDRKSILLVKRKDVPVWVLPGGGVEENELLEEAIIREIVEETGFSVKINRLVGVYLPINALAKPTHLYECSILEGIETLSSETKEIQFFPLTQLPYAIPPPFKEWICDASIIQNTVHKYLRSVTYRALFFQLLKHPVLVVRFLLARLGMPINR